MINCCVCSAALLIVCWRASDLMWVALVPRSSSITVLREITVPLCDARRRHFAHEVDGVTPTCGVAWPPG